MALNWDAFAQQVAGGIQRGASGWAGTIRSDIERKKDLQDRLAIMDAQHEHEKQLQVANHEFALQSDLVRRGLDKADAEWTADFQHGVEMRQQKTKEMFDTYLGSPELKSGWALLTMYGKGNVAKAQYDLINYIRQGGVPKPEHEQVLATMPDGPRARLAAMIKDNVSNAQDLEYKKELIEFAKAQKAAMTQKTALTIDEVSTLYQNALSKVEDVISKKTALMNSQPYQAAMTAASGFKIDPGVDLRLQKEQLAAFQKGDPSGYYRFIDAVQQLGHLDDVLSKFQPLATMWGNRFTNMQGIVPVPEPTKEDEEAEAEVQRSMATAKPSNTAQPQTPKQQIPVLGNVDKFMKNVFSNAQALNYPKKGVMKQFGITDGSKLLVLKAVSDVELLKQGLLSVPAGTFVYDPMEHKMLLSVGDGLFAERAPVKQPAK